MVFTRDALAKIVCNIRTPVGKDQAKVGTAVFIARGEIPYLLTAAHVIDDITAQTVAVLSDADGNPVSVLLSELLGGSTFVKHGQADLAKAAINVTAKNTPHLNGRFYPFNQVSTSETLLSKDLELTIIGFPSGLGATGHKFSPLTFRTFVSSPAITLPRFDNLVPCDFIILELPSAGGYSGGPVFDLGYIISGNITQTTGDTSLLGIVHGTISDGTGGKMSAITPGKYLDRWL